MENLYSPLQKTSPVALNMGQWSPAQISVDAPAMFSVPPEVTTPFALSQDLALLSYIDPPRIDYYYSTFYRFPAQTDGQIYTSGDGYNEPAYIRKRNERERQRVRCVNDGYTKLRHHLPQEYTGKRLSKVQTLRAAIRYISHLQEVLHWRDSEETRHSLQQNKTKHIDSHQQGAQFYPFQRRPPR